MVRVSRSVRDLAYRVLQEKEKYLRENGKEATIDELAKILVTHPRAKEFNILRSDEIYYEILPKNSSKGNLLEKLAEILGVDMKNTIAVGDNDNDISMLETAGTGYAVSNASQGAKEAADIITVSNEEHAIAKIIEELDKSM